MKLSIARFLAGLSLAVVGYAGAYFIVTAPQRSLLQGEKPELAWLKDEFNVNDAELGRISQLHDAYMPDCAEMCRDIDAVNTELKGLVARSGVLTPEIEERLLEAARLQVECRKRMIVYFFEVSRSMPSEQGERFLVTMCEGTFLPSHQMAGAIDTNPALKLRLTR